MIVIDSKGTLGDWQLEDYSPELMEALAQGKAARVRIVPPLEGADNSFYDSIFYFALQVGGLTIYIDELYAIAPPNAKPPTYLNALYTRGREFGIGVWSSTQRPSWIPLYTISEADHYFMFYLALDTDINRMAGFMGKGVLSPIKDAHGFYYASAQGRGATYSPRLDISKAPPKVQAGAMKGATV